MKCPNCNETEHEPTAKYCHVCGTKLKTNDNNSEKEEKNSKRKKAKQKDRMYIQYLLFLFLLLETVLISIAECKINLAWGIVTIWIVNFYCVGISVDQIESVKEGLYEDGKSGWNLYYKYFHYLVHAIGVVVGFVIVQYFHNLWAMILDMILMLLMLFIDTSLEDIL